MPLEERYLSLLRSAVGEVLWTEKKTSSFSRLFDLLLASDSRANLTALKDPLDVVLKHFVDSLTLLKLPFVQKILDEGGEVCDVGCGGGFPGLPLAIACENARLTMIDSTEKKIRLLAENAQRLGLSGVHPVSGRGEELAKPGCFDRERFDLVVSRAVANLPVLTELCLPFVKVGGVFVAMKGAKAPDEAEAARRAVGQLGGGGMEIVPVRIEADASVLSEDEIRKAREILSSARYLVVIHKEKSTRDQFPRSWAQMSKKPL